MFNDYLHYIRAKYLQKDTTAGITYKGQWTQTIKITVIMLNQPTENIDTKHNERPPQSTANNAMDKRELSNKYNSNKTSPWRDQDRSAGNQIGMLFLGHYDINETKKCRSIHTKTSY